MLLGVALVQPVCWADDAVVQQGRRAWSGGDFGRAHSLWYPLAAAGNWEAQLFLALMYERGEGVERDPEQAFGWYLRAAEQGVAAAQYEVGLRYELGRGVPADPAEADYWYGRALGQGFCPSELRLGDVLGID